LATTDALRPSEDELMNADGRQVSETEYWAYYYAFPDKHYEWNNGRLQEKPVSDNLTYWIYSWLRALLDEFLKQHPIAKCTGLEHGFRLALSDRVVIRKPDLGVVRNDNPVPLGDFERSYRGIFDLCIEALSDSDRAARERDEVEKRHDYAQGGVREYYIIHHNPERLAFLSRGSDGGFQSVLGPDGLVRSEILPGFQFHIRDLLGHRPLAALRHDPVYRSFVYPQWQQEEQARQLAEAERDATRIAAVTKLHALGLDPLQIADALDIDRALVSAILETC
jgi:hypothetical protein